MYNWFQVVNLEIKVSFADKYTQLEESCDYRYDIECENAAFHNLLHIKVSEHCSIVSQKVSENCIPCHIFHHVK